MGLGGLLGGKIEQSHERPVFWDPLGAVLGSSWRRPGAVLGAPGAVLASKMEPKSNKNGSKKAIKILTSSRLDFLPMFIDFRTKNETKIAPKWYQKSMSNLKAKNQLNASRLVFSCLSGVQVGS